MAMPRFDLSGDPDIYDLGAHIDDRVISSPLDDLKASFEKLADQQMQHAAPILQDAPWRAMQLSRELCRAQGYDPDMMVVSLLTGRQGPFGSVGASDTVPAWTLYLEMARSLSATLGEDMMPKTADQK
jgi:hypothetical protein